jgi:hypothetical protein
MLAFGTMTAAEVARQLARGHRGFIAICPAAATTWADVHHH